MKKKLRKIEWMRDITPPTSSRQYVGPPRGCVITHHTKIATRCNSCNNNKAKLVKPPRAGFQAPVNRSTNCKPKMICHRCPQLRQELQKTRDNVHLIESLLVEAKRRPLGQILTFFVLTKTLFFTASTSLQRNLHFLASSHNFLTFLKKCCFERLFKIVQNG